MRDRCLRRGRWCAVVCLSRHVCSRTPALRDKRATYTDPATVTELFSRRLSRSGLGRASRSRSVRKRAGLRRIRKGRGSWFSRAANFSHVWLAPMICSAMLEFDSALANRFTTFLQAPFPFFHENTSSRSSSLLGYGSSRDCNGRSFAGGSAGTRGRH